MVCFCLAIKIYLKVLIFSDLIFYLLVIAIKKTTNIV
jgi:hypothetical protein